MIRLGAALLVAVAAPLAAQVTLSQSQPASEPEPAKPAVYIPLSAEERWNDYMKRNFTLKGVGGRAARLGVTNLWSNDPPEWGRGAEGYGKRMASGFGRSFVRRSVEAAGAAALGHDPRYIRCPCDGKWKRVAHAFSQSVLTYDNDGKRVFGYARVGARYAGTMSELAWFPDRYGWKDGFREGSQSFLTVGAFNVAREFWPDIKGVFGR
jgi:hypothetical protein